MTSPVPAVVGRIPLPGKPERLAYFNGLIYAALSDGRVVKVNAGTGELLADVVGGYSAPAVLDFHRTIPNPEVIGPGEPDRRIYVPRPSVGDGSDGDGQVMTEIVPGRFDTYRHFPLGPGVSVMDVVASPTNSVVYYADFGNKCVGVFNPDAGGTVTTYPMSPAPETVTVSPDGRYVFALSEGGGTLTAIDTAENPPAIMPLNANMGVGAGVAVTPDLRAVVGQNFSSLVFIYDLQSQEMHRVGVGRNPAHVIIDTAGTFAYSSNFDSSSVCKIDLRIPRTVHNIFGFARPLGMCFSDDQTTLYVANHGSSDISVVSL